MDDSSTNKYQVFRNCRLTPPFPQGKKPSGSMQIVFREGLKQKSGQVWALGMSNLLGKIFFYNHPQNIRPTTVTIFLRSISGSQIPSGSSFERRPFSLVMVILFDLGMLHRSLPQASREMLHCIGNTDFVRILQGSKIATQAAQLPLEIVESERHCSPQQIAGINDLPVVLSAAETLRICGKGNTGKTGGPKKQPLPILCIEFISSMSWICVRVCPKSIS